MWVVLKYKSAVKVYPKKVQGKALKSYLVAINHVNSLHCVTSLHA
jgi:hypothetical protein